MRALNDNCMDKNGTDQKDVLIDNKQSKLDEEYDKYHDEELEERYEAIMEKDRLLLESNDPRDMMLSKILNADIDYYPDNKPRDSPIVPSNIAIATTKRAKNQNQKRRIYRGRMGTISLL